MSYNLLIDDENLETDEMQDETVLSGTAGFLPLKNLVNSPFNNGSNMDGTANSSERPANPEGI